MDAYILQNKENMRIIGEVIGPGTWCYIKKNGKKGKVTQVYAGAIFKFNNFHYPDIKAYEITGKFKGLQKSVVSGEVQNLPLKVAESENNYMDEITLLKIKIDELTSRCEKLEAALGDKTALKPKNPKNPQTTPNTSSSTSRKRNRKSKRHICATEDPVVEHHVLMLSNEHPIASHVLYNCTECCRVECKLEIVEQKYCGPTTELLLNGLSKFIKRANYDGPISLELFDWADETLGPNSPYDNVEDLCCHVLKTHDITKVLYSLEFVKNNCDKDMVKAFYRAYLLYLQDCKDNCYDPFDDARLADFFEEEDSSDLP